MTDREYAERAESLDAILCAQELYLRRYGVYEEYRGDDDLGPCVFKYSIPEKSELDDYKGILDDGKEIIAYDMRNPEHIISLLSRFITSFICDMAVLEVDRNDGDELTEEERQFMINYMAKSVADSTDVQVVIRDGEIWTDEDYDEGVEYYDSRVVTIDSDVPEEEKELLIAMYKEEFGDESIGIANWSDSSDV